MIIINRPLPTTEKEWPSATDPESMLEVLQGKASDRKSRLFCCQCCRLMWSSLMDVHSRSAVEFAERLADGEANADESESALSRAMQVKDDATLALRTSQTYPNEYPSEGVMLAASAVAGTVCSNISEFTLRRVCRDSRLGMLKAGSFLVSKETVNASLCFALRDIFGNPFRPVTADPRWRTETAVALATGIYAERAFDRMPILADALEEAGCDNRDVLDHCRGNGTHVRGCWVVDLVLGKE